MTRERLSQLSGVRPAEIAAIERGGCCPTIGTAGPLARAVGKGVWELLTPSPDHPGGLAAETADGHGRRVVTRAGEG